MPTAGALHCPTCGAAASSTRARKCSYCGTRLAAVRCSGCFGTLFDGNRFCPHCGAIAAHRLGTDFERIGCPRCKTGRDGPLMDPVALNDVHLDECPSCAGVWLDHATFGRVCTTAAAQSDALKLLGAPRRQTERRGRYLRCPLCDEQMARRNYARQSGVILDFCASHGMWFDHDELRRVVEFVRAGGLGEARRADEERAAADNERRAREAKLFGRSPWQDEGTDAGTDGGSDAPSHLIRPETARLLGLLVRRIRGR
jgi:Zn-finger nucleic acid-binding protein